MAASRSNCKVCSACPQMALSVQEVRWGLARSSALRSPGSNLRARSSRSQSRQGVRWGLNLRARRALRARSAVVLNLRARRSLSTQAGGDLRARSSALSVQGVRRLKSASTVYALSARSAVGLKSPPRARCGGASSPMPPPTTQRAIKPTVSARSSRRCAIGGAGRASALSVQPSSRRLGRRGAKCDEGRLLIMRIQDASLL